MRNSLRGDRLLGALIGAVLAAFAAAASAWLETAFTAVIAVGFPSGVFVGFVMAPRLVTSRTAWRPAIASAAAAVLLTTISTIVLGMIETGAPTFVYLLLMPFILFFAFIIGMPIAVPMALIGTWLLRRVVRL